MVQMLKRQAEEQGQSNRDSSCNSLSLAVKNLALRSADPENEFHFQD
jgi:hypothetical protein